MLGIATLLLCLLKGLLSLLKLIHLHNNVAEETTLSGLDFLHTGKERLHTRRIVIISLLAAQALGHVILSVAVLVMLQRLMLCLDHRDPFASLLAQQSCQLLRVQPSVLRVPPVGRFSAVSHDDVMLRVEASVDHELCNDAQGIETDRSGSLLLLPNDLVNDALARRPLDDVL